LFVVVWLDEITVNKTRKRIEQQRVRYAEYRSRKGQRSHEGNMKTFLGIPLEPRSEAELIEVTRRNLKPQKIMVVLSIVIFSLIIFLLIPQMYKLVTTCVFLDKSQQWHDAVLGGLIIGLLVGCLLTSWIQVMMTMLISLMGKHYVQRRDQLLVKYYDMVKEAEKQKMECEQIVSGDRVNPPPER
jgi:hypothetical protein